VKRTVCLSKGCIRSDGLVGLIDGRPAILADIGEVYDVAVDAIGNVFFSTRRMGLQDADDSQRLVREIDPDGTITTVAGGGTRDGSIDGVPATEAELLGGWLNIEVDSEGDLYISEPAGHRVRKVTFSP
jgi:hypothetical protein